MRLWHANPPYRLNSSHVSLPDVGRIRIAATSTSELFSKLFLYQLVTYGTGLIIISPEHDEHYHLRAFLRVPITQGGFWMLVDEEAAIGFIDRFIKMWNGNQVWKNRTMSSSLLSSKGA